MPTLPRLYAILDAACFADEENMFAAAEELEKVGVRLVQYRNKSGNARTMLTQVRELRRRLAKDVRLIMNDRADLALTAGFDGVHVGQDDLPAEGARRVIGSRMLLGVSTHNESQVLEAGGTSADYIAIGPVFATSSKAKPDPVIGLDGVRRARSLTEKPIAAIGGITRGNCRAVIDAGADAVAVISDLVTEPGKSAEEFLRILR